ncbi:nucleoside/nucleotide kinase family protein [Flavobacterium aciduliphilum]|uniref:EF-hand domain-containing protein n=1 Tax=Flavobacterium aciduliphilum TaxID=1101402 RepID=A0A328YQV2_9FLAO|nr:hypothetical protein [Flavobacterium aciduliphilum]RAR75744.1 hypothetical protein CLV55_101448 [Flavobacterium aciduliphilum]
MTNYIKMSLFGLMVLFVGCKNEADKPKVTYNTKEKAINVKNDTAQIKVADLPIHFEGTSVLLFPVGDINVYGRTSGMTYDSSSSETQQSFTISNNTENEITGFLQNVGFQEIGNDSICKLTEKPILIETITFLKTIADKTKKQFLIYTLTDSDTNTDGKIDSNDVKSLYLSNVKGEGFVKLSPDIQELIDWNVVENLNRIYFRTIEDINKNGAFDKEDKVRYYYLDLLAKESKVMEYTPI